MDFVNDVASLGYIVHHKCYIDTSNVFDSNITLNFENLELLCLDCHNKEHFEVNDFTKDGMLKEQDDDLMKLAGVYKK